MSNTEVIKKGHIEDTDGAFVIDEDIQHWQAAKWVWEM